MRMLGGEAHAPEVSDDSFAKTASIVPALEDMVAAVIAQPRRSVPSCKFEPVES